LAALIGGTGLGGTGADAAIVGVVTADVVVVGAVGVDLEVVDATEAAGDTAGAVVAGPVGVDLEVVDATEAAGGTAGVVVAGPVDVDLEVVDVTGAAGDTAGVATGVMSFALVVTGDEVEAVVTGGVDGCGAEAPGDTAGVDFGVVEPVVTGCVAFESATTGAGADEGTDAVDSGALNFGVVFTAGEDVDDDAGADVFGGTDAAGVNDGTDDEAVADAAPDFGNAVLLAVAGPGSDGVGDDGLVLVVASGS
jgi:hypothetical protein